MKTSDFYYDLPKELIAQTPADTRSASRLMVCHPSTRSVEHRHFYDIIDYLNPGDCMVVNDTKVIPARLIGRRADTGGQVEVLLLNRYQVRDAATALEPVREEHIQEGENVWECLVHPGKKARPGQEIVFGDGRLRAKVCDIGREGNRIITFSHEGIFEEVLDALGTMPLPPYITETLAEKDRYQTVYARYEGSAAAPTAGLHFTPALLDAIRAKGVHVVPVTLHVGLGTFRPVKVEDVNQHVMHSEYYVVPEETARIIRRTKEVGGRIIAVGTTATRTLEAASSDGITVAGSGYTDIFIYPGYRFRTVDALITNFHLPESTLMMLVSALAGRDFMMESYAEAVRARYRFFSFGDAMFISESGSE
ncbi:MAG: tRNA preQ1(34) S-adenosylmethionine ribosyltransferase-isomerase QueA [Eubacteriales bacterium]|nr:tRNA preQ1(34) S-adenosylmethionine ribosyltransferase-isomerase QueA [Eubacteriales bacterium]